MICTPPITDAMHRFEIRCDRLPRDVAVDPEPEDPGPRAARRRTELFASVRTSASSRSLGQARSRISIAIAPAPRETDGDSIMPQVFPEPEGGRRALSARLLRTTTHGFPYEKSLLNDIHAALECHRLHPRYQPIADALRRAGTARIARGPADLKSRWRPIAPLRMAKCIAQRIGDGRRTMNEGRRTGGLAQSQSARSAFEIAGSPFYWLGGARVRMAVTLSEWMRCERIGWMSRCVS